jgi:hypothetical protein
VSNVTERFIPRSRVALATVLFAAPLFAGCPDPTVTAKDPTLAEAEGKSPDALCQSATDRNNPIIVEWPATQKVELESVASHGIVVVNFQGCKLTVLSRCQASGAYKFEATTPQRDGIDVKDEDDLFAKLPVASQALRAELASGKALKLDYVLVGRRMTDASAPEMNGDCAGATHFVKTIALGAYDMKTAARASGGAGIDIGIVQMGGDSKSERNRARSSGNVDGCAQKTDIDESNVRSAGCSAPVQLGLEPLAGVAAPTATN